MSSLEDLLAVHLQGAGLPDPQREHRFHPTRLWRFDFAWPDQGIAVEVEGGTWANGRHTRGSGYELDCEKSNEALLLGWRVFRVTGAQVRRGEAVQLVQRVFKYLLEDEDGKA